MAQQIAPAAADAAASDSADAAGKTGDSARPTPELSAYPGGGGDDAVCFTAGLRGAYFGAGVIHAYLAARRRHPVVTAGISAGALSATALQKCYKNLSAPAGGNGAPAAAGGDLKAQLEADRPQRWSWFRDYVRLLTDNPLSVVWDAIPDISDFFADMPPIRDTSLRPQNEETRARRQRYVLIKLGRRLASLPISVRRATETIVNYVRTRERYGTLSPIRLLVRIIYLTFKLSLYVSALSKDNFYRGPRVSRPRPQPSENGGSVDEGSVAEKKAGPEKERLDILPRPLFGWSVFGIAWLIAFSGIALMASTLAEAVLFLTRNWNLLCQCPQLLWWPAAAGALLLWAQVRGVADIQVFTPEYSLRSKIWAVAKLAPAWFVVTMAIAALAKNHDRFLHFPSIPLIVSAVAAAVILRIVVLVLAALPFRSFFPRVRWNLLHFVEWLLQWLLPWATLTLALVALLTSDIWSRLKAGPPDSAFQPWTPGYWDAGFVVFISALLIAVAGAWNSKRRQTENDPDATAIGWAGGVLLKNVGLSEALISDFYGLQRLKEMFDPTAVRDDQGRLFTEVENRLCRCLIPLSQPGNECPACHKKAEQGVRSCQCPAPIDPELAQCTVCGMRLMSLLVVAAPLQALPPIANYPSASQQVWASPGEKLVTALRAALSLPGLVEPVRFDKKDKPGLDNWISQGQIDRVDLVDGTVVRQNPLPALFSFLNKNKHIAQQLSEGSPERKSVHVIFSVPLKPRHAPVGDETPGAEASPDVSSKTRAQDAPLPVAANIVDVGLLSLQLAKRRDTKLEVQQTNFIGELEAMIIAAKGKSALPEWNATLKATGASPAITSIDTLPILADSVAPEDEVDLGSRINPDQDKGLQAVAHGCRQMLQRLYAQHVPEHPGAIQCRDLLAKVWKIKTADVPEPPGLAEVCSHCTQRICSPAGEHKEVKAPGKEGETTELEFRKKDFPQLTAEQPRVIFVASGGVFRGVFQIGVLAALLKAKVKIDLVVGASVGTLMGGALAAAQTSKWEQALGVISEIVTTFVEVDSRIALTTTLKCAARELGLRGRSIHLSPNDLQRMVQRGSRFDAGYVVAGAPPALLDAISTLLVIPYEKTKDIAAQLVAGHVSDALNLLRKAVSKETLKRLGIEDFVMGTSLLMGTSQKLLFPGGLDGRDRKPQPYLDQNGKGVALLATTTNLLTWESKLLGKPGDFGGSYNFVEAALSSSAFPAVFRPRRETDVYPGFGDPKVMYADGGLFDNLPFFPAMEVLGSVQEDHLDERIRSTGSGNNALGTTLDFLQERHHHPDLFIAGSLDADPDSDKHKDGPFKSILAVRNRAMMLDANLKIKDFQLAATRIHAQIDRLLQNRPVALSGKNLRQLKVVVDAAVLPVFPTDQQHLNGTFAFSRTLGLQKERIQTSAADGCFQTLATIARAQAYRPDPKAPGFDPSAIIVNNPNDLLSKTVWSLFKAGKMPYIVPATLPPWFRLRTVLGTPDSGKQPCPFFQMTKSSENLTTEPFSCPFTEIVEENSRGVFKQCCDDKAHVALFTIKKQEKDKENQQAPGRVQEKNLVTIQGVKPPENALTNLKP